MACHLKTQARGPGRALCPQRLPGPGHQSGESKGSPGREEREGGARGGDPFGSCSNLVCTSFASAGETNDLRTGEEMVIHYP